jgi:hypothetical protein
VSKTTLFEPSLINKVQTLQGMNLKQIIPISLFILLLAVLCIWIAGYSMGGLQDCNGYDSFPRPLNCADDKTLLTVRIMGYAGIALIVLALFLPFFLQWRKRTLAT